MSSRPECNICGERITMGGCNCKEPWFGDVMVVDGVTVKDERPKVWCDKTNNWVLKEKV